MKRHDKKSSSYLRQGVSTGQTKGAPETEALLRLGRILGNDVIQQRLASGNSHRDLLIQHIAGRVDGVRDIQNREIDALDRPRSWWKDVSDSQKEGHTKPDPTRWAPVARGYERALYQLSEGRLALGAQLLEQARKDERTTRSATSQVVDITGLDERNTAAPAASHPHDACTPCDAPAELEATLQAIESCSRQTNDPPVKGRVKDPWWGEDVDEEEEEDDNEG